MLKFLSFFLLVLLLSCSKDTLYSGTVEIDNSTWGENQPLTYDWFVLDTTIKYDIILNIKHNDQISSQNIYVKCISQSKDILSNEQIVSLELLNSQGIPFGTCSLGECVVNIVLVSNIFFPELGQHKLLIYPYSRISPIVGLKEVKLTIEKTKFKS